MSWEWMLGLVGKKKEDRESIGAVCEGNGEVSEVGGSSSESTNSQLSTNPPKCAENPQTLESLSNLIGSVNPEVNDINEL